MQRRFVFLRDQDPTGISGLGLVVEGVEYSDGHCAYRWMTTHRTDQAAPDMATVRAVHGHQGSTRIVYLDGPDGTPNPDALRLVAAHEAGQDAATAADARARRGGY